MTTAKTDYTCYDPDQVNEFLTAWGRWDGVNNSMAGAHLLTFTNLALDPDMVACLHIRSEWVRLGEGETTPSRITVASVADWEKLIRLAHSGSERNLLTLARAYIASCLIQLPQHLSGFGYAGARRVVEAMAIATGYADWLTISLGGPGLDAYNQHQTSFGLPTVEAGAQ